MGLIKTYRKNTCYADCAKPAKIRARAFGLRGRTLKFGLSGDTLELERGGLRNV